MERRVAKQYVHAVPASRRCDQNKRNDETRYAVWVFRPVFVLVAPLLWSRSANVWRSPLVDRSMLHLASCFYALPWEFCSHAAAGGSVFGSRKWFRNWIVPLFGVCECFHWIPKEVIAMFSNTSFPGRICDLCGESWAQSFIWFIYRWSYWFVISVKSFRIDQFRTNLLESRNTFMHSIHSFESYCLKLSLAGSLPI